MNFLMTTNMIPFNNGNKPTFKNYRRSEVLDVTIISLSIIDYIKDRQVLDDLSFSDHCYITFNIVSYQSDILKRQIRLSIHFFAELNILATVFERICCSLKCHI